RPVTFKNGVPSHPDTLWTTNTYSNDGLNLLIKTTQADLTTCYRYHKDTDLLAAKFILKDDKIYIREYFHYDENAALIYHSIDDGCKEDWDFTGVTERRVTIIQNTNTHPFGLPQVIEEYAYASGEEVLLSQKVNHYNALGQCTQQDIYDSQRQHLYSLYW